MNKEERSKLKIEISQKTKAFENALKQWQENQNQENAQQLSEASKDLEVCNKKFWAPLFDED